MLTDLRSDTVTLPSPGMLEAMHNAPLGDDVFGEDPSINSLEEFVAELFGMERALFCASGTMTNQIAIKCHTRPGNEVICDENAHVYIYEGGGIAFNSGCQVKPLKGERGCITAIQVEEAINPDDVHKPVTSLVCLENTANRGGGRVYDEQEIEAIVSVCRKNNLGLHLDGARLWNALVHTGQTPRWYGKRFDSISVCLSKGLGAPVGSLLLGSAPFIKEARRVRKVLGGGMRQAGSLAAAGKYAIENNFERLLQDHHHAKQIARILNTLPFIGKVLPVDTNILIFEVIGRFTPKSFTERLKEFDILCLPISTTSVRMVFHLNINKEMTDRLARLLTEI